jgi:hypothetical protein
VPKGKRKSEPYVQPPEMDHLHVGQFRCMEEGIEILPAGPDATAGAKEEETRDPLERQRDELHRIWELAAALHFIRCFRQPLGLSSLTAEDFHTAFMECRHGAPPLATVALTHVPTVHSLC